MVGISLRETKTGMFPGHDRNNNQRSARRRHAGSGERRIQYPVDHSKQTLNVTLGPGAQTISATYCMSAPARLPWYFEIHTQL